MKKNISIASLIAVTGFMISTFATAKFHAGFGTDDRFGYPFTFFSAFNEGEVLRNKNFSGVAFVTDFGIYFLIALLVIMAINLLKVERKETSTFLHEN